MGLGVEPLSFVSDGLTDELQKRLRQLAGDRAQELGLLRDEFADPHDLARCYVEPHLQCRSVADRGRCCHFPVPRQGAFSLLNQFLGSSASRSRDGSRQLFLLGDAGMGKTSLLLMLKLMQLAGFWPSGCRCELFRLGGDTLAQMAAVEEKSDTVLLLDGLNEDRLARDRVLERLQDLLQGSREFRRVIISSRPHFFPEVLSGGSGQPIIRGLSGYNCPVLHLSPFDDQQVLEALDRRLGRKNSRYLGFHGFGAGRQKTQACRLLEQIQEVRLRPLLLRYIEILLESDEQQEWNLCTAYEALVQRQTEQRCGCLESLPERMELLDSCVRIATWMEERDSQEIAERELAELLRADGAGGTEPDHCSLLSRTSRGAWRFVHATFREFLLARALADERLRPLFPVRTTDQLASFLDLSGGISAYIARLDCTGFDPIRYVDCRGKLFFWQDRILRRRSRPQMGPDMIVLPGGRFRMGDIRGRDADNAQPVHEVELDSFALGRCPVTFAEYDEFCTATGRGRPRDGGWGRDRRPVINVSWQDAADYCDWLCRETGRHYRLPTEAEWEYGCRAGSESAYCFGDDEEQLERHAWYVKNAERRTQPVGCKQANAWGLCDMHGNVWEWCSDWYDKDSYPECPVRNPVGAEQGAGRVLRGGSWDSSGRFASSSYRFCLSPGLRIVRVGFRLAMGGS